MKPKPAASRLSAKEKNVLAFFIVTSLLVWGVLGLSFVALYGQPLAAQEAFTSTVQPISSLVSTYTSTPTSAPESPVTPAVSMTLSVHPTGTSIVPVLSTSTVTPTASLSNPLEVLLGKDTQAIVLLGIDEKSTSSLWRTDSIILAFVAQKTDRLALLSIPRDLWVNIPGHGYNRINTVDALGERTEHPGGGLALLDETLQKNLGIPVHHYVRIDFEGFVRIIDAIGGVTVNVEKPLTDKFPDPLSASGYSRITLPKGPCHMDGHMALSYCRSRITTSDFDRSRRQQQVLVALLKQSLTLETLAQAPKLWSEFNSAFDTDLSMVEAVQLAYWVYGIDADNVHSAQLDFSTARPWTTAQGAQVLLPQTEAIQQIVLDLLSDTDGE